ncbi:MAG: hypothetical protein LM590_12165 [Thermofilum sp.]|nr:hypothetical protein [Thermofilum sp.]
MSGRRTWDDLVLEAMKNLGADVKPVALKDIYNAVERLAPSMCDNSNVYVLTYKGRVVREPRWRRNVRDALLKLRRRGLVASKGRGSWMLVKAPFA